MPSFSYTGRNEAGGTVKGTLRASNEARARALLAANNVTPLTVTSAAQRSLLQRDVLGGGVGAKDLVLLSRQLGAMISAGVPILQALQALARQVEKDAFERLLNELAGDIEGGVALSVSLAKHPAIFSPFFVGVVRTGEASGQLADALDTLADYLEENYVFVRKVRSALLYPAFVLVGAVIVVSLMFIYIVPQLVTLFTEAAVELPLATRVLIVVTDLVTHYWYLGLGLAVILALVLRSYLKTPDGHYTLSLLAVRLPGLRGLAIKLYLAQVTAILYTLFKSDVSIVKALEVARDSIGNAVYASILDRTLIAVQDGATISDVWETEELIPPMLTTMVAVGEQSGDLANSFAEAGRFFRRDVDEMLATISTLLEPLLVILLGIAVAFIVAGVLLPIYNLVLVF